jgi:hypothetical protein
MSLSYLCIILAFVCWLLGAANVSRPPINWLCAGLAFCALAWLIVGTVPLR